MKRPILIFKDEPNCYNNFKCRFCEFDATGIKDILKQHYKEFHPVEGKKDEETGTIKIYQGGEVIGTYGVDHNYCCITNCINGRKPNMDKFAKIGTPKLAIRLKRGGDYAAIEQYFEGYFEGGSYFDAPSGIFVCIEHLEETTKENATTILQWIMEFGLLATFKLVQLKEIKNRNLIIISKTPLPKNVVFVKETIVKCGITQSKAEMIDENKRLSSIIKDLTHALKTANKEKEVLKQKLIDDNAAKCLEIQRLKETLTNAGFPLILLSTGEIDLDLTNYNKPKQPREDDDNNEAKQSTPKKMKEIINDARQYMRDDQHIEEKVKKILEQNLKNCAAKLMSEKQIVKPTEEETEKDPDQTRHTADEEHSQKNMMKLKPTKKHKLTQNTNPGPSMHVIEGETQMAPVTYYYQPKTKKPRAKLLENKEHTSFVICETCQEVCVDRRQLASHKKKYHTSFSVMKQYYRTLHKQ